MSNRGCDCVAGLQSRLAFVTLTTDRSEKPRIEGRYLVKQNHKNETAGKNSEDADGILA